MCVETTYVWPCEANHVVVNVQKCTMARKRVNDRVPYRSAAARPRRGYDEDRSQQSNKSSDGTSNADDNPFSPKQRLRSHGSLSSLSSISSLSSLKSLIRPKSRRILTALRTKTSSLFRAMGQPNNRETDYLHGHHPSVYQEIEDNYFPERYPSSSSSTSTSASSYFSYQEPDTPFPSPPPHRKGPASIFDAHDATVYASEISSANVRPAAPAPAPAPTPAPTLPPGGRRPTTAFHSSGGGDSFSSSCPLLRRRKVRRDTSTACPKGCAYQPWACHGCLRQQAYRAGGCGVRGSRAARGKNKGHWQAPLAAARGWSCDRCGHRKCDRCPPIRQCVCQCGRDDNILPRRRTMRTRTMRTRTGERAAERWRGDEMDDEVDEEGEEEEYSGCPGAVASPGLRCNPCFLGHCGVRRDWLLDHVLTRVTARLERGQERRPTRRVGNVAVAMGKVMKA